MAENGSVFCMCLCCELMIIFILQPVVLRPIALHCCLLHAAAWKGPVYQYWDWGTAGSQSKINVLSLAGCSIITATVCLIQSLTFKLLVMTNVTLSLFVCVCVCVCECVKVEGSVTVLHLFSFEPPFSLNYGGLHCALKT